jgi:hypothetical protein
MKWRIGSPSRDSRVVPSGRWPWFCCSRIEAEVRARAAAVDALATLRREQRHDVVADGDVTHPFADGLDDACALVSEHGRRVAGRVGAGGRVHVGVTDAARDQPDQRLAGSGAGEVELLHDERPTELLEQRGANPHEVPRRLIDPIVDV